MIKFSVTHINDKIIAEDIQTESLPTKGEIIILDEKQNGCYRKYLVVNVYRSSPNFPYDNTEYNTVEVVKY